MRIVVVHSRYRSAFPSGENQVVDRERALLRSAGHEVLPYERQSDEIAGWSRTAKLLLPARIVWSEQERRRLTLFLRRVGPDVVHVHNTFPLFSPSVLTACADAGVPVVATLHNFRIACANGMLTRDGRPCRLCVGRAPVAAVRYGCYRDSAVQTLPIAVNIAAHRALRTWHRGVDRFLVLSGFGRDILIDGGLPPGKLVVKPNFVDDPGQVRTGPGRYLLYLGRLGPEKGLGLLMAAWERRTAPGRLVIAGDGPMRERVSAWARRADGAEYLGRLPQERCAEVIRGARAVVLPSPGEEPFGLAAIEAFAGGVPAMGCASGALPELIEEGGNGWLVPPADETAMARVFDLALSDDEVVQVMGKRARGTYEARFAPSVNLAQLERVYRDVAVRDAPRSTPGAAP